MNLGTLKSLVNLIKIMLQDSNCKVKIEGQLTVKEGNALPTILFNILLES
jgi:hypothetical protein